MRPFPSRFCWLIVAFSGAIATAAEYAIPTARRPVSWEANVVTGVVGGIPTRSGGNVINVATYGWSSGASGATNTAAFASALAASAEGDIISIPAGTFATDGIVVTWPYKNRTIRGAGMGVTILRHIGVGGIVFGSDTNVDNNDNPITTVTAMTRGSDTITVTDGAAVWTGYPAVARLQLAQEIVTPVVHVSNYYPSRTPVVYITARSGNTLTLSQPLPSAFAEAMAAGTCTLKHLTQQGDRGTAGMGLEDLTIDGVNATGNHVVTVFMRWAVGCWFKDVEIINPGNYAIKMTDTVGCEIRRCKVNGLAGGSNRAGLLLEQSSYALIEDNIFYNGSPDIEANFSNMNCAIVFNRAGIMNGNHGPHNSYNLWEGNAVWYYQADGYFGSVSEETLFRNWFASGVSASLKRFTRNFNYIANVVGESGGSYSSDYSEKWGDPNIGNEDYTGTAQPSVGDWWADWNTGTGAPNPVGATGFQERDLDVAATTIRKANWYAITGDIPSGEALGSDTLPVSYVRVTKPSWWGDRPWPAYNSASPGTPTIAGGALANIPAGYREANGGADPPPDGTVATPGFSPVAGTYGTTQTVSISCGTSGATIYYTLDGSSPSTSSSVYSSALTVSATTTIKTYAVKSGLTDSAVNTGVFTISSGGAAPAYSPARLAPAMLRRR